MFITFVRCAESKLSYYLMLHMNKEIDLSIPLQESQDPQFDSILNSLASVSKHCPKLIVDSIMVWRKSKSDEKVVSSSELRSISQKYPALRLEEIEDILKTRRSCISNFIVCRALIAVLKALDGYDMPRDLGEKLEDMGFKQLLSANPDNNRSLLRQANLDFFGKLMGSLSTVRFATVSDRFISELSHLTASLTPTNMAPTPASMKAESKIELILKSMKYLHLKIYPMDALEESAEFLSILADFFQRDSSARVKCAFAEIFVELLEPIAVVASTEVNLPAWMKTVELIFPNAGKMMLKPKQQIIAISLITTLLCVSKRDFFQKKIGEVLDSILPKLKDRTIPRSLVMNSLVRLTWVNLFRCPDANTSGSIRRVELIIKSVFPTTIGGKKGGVPGDIPLNSFVQLAYFVCVKHLEYGLENVLFGTLITPPDTLSRSNSVSKINGQSSTLQRTTSRDDKSAANNLPVIGNLVLDIPKLIIAIRLFLLLLADAVDAVTPINMVEEKEKSNANVVVEGKLNIPPPPFPIKTTHPIAPQKTSLGGTKHENTVEQLISYRAREATGNGLSAHPGTSGSSTGSHGGSLFTETILAQKRPVVPGTTGSALQNVDEVEKFSGMIEEVVFLKVGKTMKEYWEKICGISMQVLQGLNVGSGMLVLVDGKIYKGPQNDLKSKEGALSDSSQEIGQDRNGYSSSIDRNIDRSLSFELIRTCIDSFPRLLHNPANALNILELLSRYTLHADEGIRNSSIAALLRIAKCKSKFWAGVVDDGWYSGGLPGKIARFSMNTVCKILNERLPEFLLGSSCEHVELITLNILEMYLSLLQLWKERSLEDRKGILSLWKHDAEVNELVCEIEGKAILFLCSVLPKVRKTAVQILRFAVKLESTLNGDEGTKTDDVDKLAEDSDFDSSHLTVNKSRIVHILKYSGYEVVKDYVHDPATVAKPSDRQKKEHFALLSENRLNSLLLILESETISDKLIWYRALPDLFKKLFVYANRKVLLNTLGDLIERLSSMNSLISQDSAERRLSDEIILLWKIYLSFACATIEITSTGSSIDEPNVLTNSRARISNSLNSIDDPNSLMNSRALFQLILMHLSNDRMIIRQSSVVALSSIHHCSYRVFLNELEPYLNICIDDMKKIGRGSLKGVLNLENSLRRVKRLPQELLYVFGKISEFIKFQESWRDDISIGDLSTGNSQSDTTSESDFYEISLSSKILKTIRRFIEETIKFLTDLKIQQEYEYQTFRYNFCVFIEKFYDQFSETIGVISAQSNQSVILIKNSTPKIIPKAVWDKYGLDVAMFPFLLRIRIFKLFESWTGFGMHSIAVREFQDKVISSVLDGIRDSKERAALSATLDEQRKSLELAALKAMAVLCKGPLFDPFTNSIETSISHSLFLPIAATPEKRNSMLISGSQIQYHRSKTSESQKISDEFDFPALIMWIDSLFATSDEKLLTIAKNALDALLTYAGTDKNLLLVILKQCYVGSVKIPNTTGSSSGSLTVQQQVQITRGYFCALVEILNKNRENESWKSHIETTGEEWKRYPFEPHWLLTLALYKMGDPSLQIRKAAVKLLHVVESDFFGPLVGEKVKGHDLAREVDKADEKNEVYEQTAITSSLPIVYKYAQAIISARFADERAEWSLEMLSEMILRIEMLSQAGDVSGYPQSIRDILVFMVPWIRNIDLSVIYEMESTSKGDPIFDTQSQKSRNSAHSSVENRFLKKPMTNSILTNLFYLTVAFSDEYVTELETLWVQLTEDVNSDVSDEDTKLKTQRNVYIIVNYLLDIGIQKRNPKYVPHAKKIMVYISRTRLCFELVEYMLRIVNPKSLVPNNLEASGSPNSSGIGFGLGNGSQTGSVTKLGEPTLPTADEGKGLYTADLNKVLPDMPNRPQFSRGQLSCVLIVDLAIEVGSVTLRNHLPVLLHVVFVQLDHFITLICDQSRLLLLHLLQNMISVANLDNLAAIHGKVRFQQRYEALIDSLTQKEGKRLWPYEDVYPSKPRNLKSIKQLQTLITEVVEILVTVEPELLQLWGEIALEWGVNCPVRHIACRSLQIFRTLMPAFTQQMLGELMFRLSNTIADQMSEIQGYALEILITLHAMIDSLDENRINTFPQFFWAGVACLYSPHEWEYLEGVLILTKLLQKIDVTDANSRNALISMLPQKWKHQFGGLQPLLLRGLNSSKAEGASLHLINFLVDIEHDLLVDTNPLRRLLCSVLANLPRLMQGFEIDPGVDDGSLVDLNTEECLHIAEILSESATKKGNLALARLLSAYAKKKFRSKEDFLRQLLQIIRDSYFPVYEHATLHFIMGLLSNRLAFYRRRALRILKLLLPSLDPAPVAELATIFNVEEDLIMPLIGLLPTDLGEEAVDVLEAAVRGSNNKGDVNLRMVLGAKSIHKIVKEANSSQEPRLISGDDTGWRVRDPERALKLTRYNMAGVSFTCRGTFDALTGGRRNRAPTNSGTKLEKGSMESTLVSISETSQVTNYAKPTNSSKISENIQLWQQESAVTALPAPANNRVEALRQSFQQLPGVHIDDSVLEALEDLDDFFAIQESGSSQSTSGNVSDAMEANISYRFDEARPIASSQTKQNTFKPFEDIDKTDRSLSEMMIGDVELRRQSVASDASLNDRPPARSQKAVGNAAEEQGMEPISENAYGPTMNDEEGVNTTIVLMLLQKTSSSVHIRFRIIVPTEEMLREGEQFEYWLRSDLSSALHVRVNRILVENFEPDGEKSFPGRQNANLEEEEGMLVSVQIINDGQNSHETLRIAERLKDMIVRTDSPLSGGVVTCRLDTIWEPEILVGCYGIRLPYITESVSSQNISQKRFTAIAFTPPSIITKSSATELLRLFPEVFELSLYLYLDWLSKVDQYFTKNSIDLKSISSIDNVDLKSLIKVYKMVKRLRARTDSNYIPSLENDEELLSDVSKTLVTYQETGNPALKNFLDQYAQLLDEFNNAISVYFRELHLASKRQDFPKPTINLARGLLEVYDLSLRLQSLADDFLDAPEDLRLQEIEALEQTLHSVKNLCE
ncbi:Cell morphogenesis protein PAG1 [Nowakowskiella sp. JEL0407]|nr:Cell morphogenesis protein PAG1 [Nowakowskiella sp. JEL0407]